MALQTQIGARGGKDLTMRLMTRRAHKTVGTTDLVRVRDFLKLPHWRVTAIADAWLIDLHRRPLIRMRVVAVGTANAGPIMGRSWPLVDVGASRMTTQTKVLARLMHNIAVRVVASRTVKRTGRVIAACRERGANSMGMLNILQSLHFGVARIASLWRYRARMVGRPAGRRRRERGALHTLGCRPRLSTDPGGRCSRRDVVMNLMAVRTSNVMVGVARRSPRRPGASRLRFVAPQADFAALAGTDADTGGSTPALRQQANDRVRFESTRCDVVLGRTMAVFAQLLAVNIRHK